METIEVKVIAETQRVLDKKENEIQFSAEKQRAKWIAAARNQFLASIKVKQQMLEGDYLDTLVSMAQLIAARLALGGKLMICGNGGSAADAQHLAAELLVRLRSHVNRDSIPAMSLAMDVSTLTACGNDYGFDGIYERLVQGLGQQNDVLLGISTSGRSANVIRALEAARDKGISTLGFIAGDGGKMLAACDLAMVVPSKDTDRAQEVHITAGHILMDFVESMLLERGYIKLNVE